MTLITGGENGGQGNSSTQAQGDAGSQGSGTQGSGDGQGQGQGGGQGGGQSSQSWRDSLSEDLKKDGSLAQFKDIESLAKAFVHTKSMVGKKGVIVPGDKATDEEWGAFFDSIGRPTADKYEVKTPEGKEINKDFVSQFKEIAHKNGVLPKQAQAILDQYITFEEGMATKQTDAMKQAKAQAVDGLKKEWGEGFDKNISLAKMAVKESGVQGLEEYLTKTGLGDDPVVIKLMAKMGSMFGEDKLRGDAPGGRLDGQTPAELKSAIDKVMGDKNHPYHDRNHPGHNRAVQEMSGYYQKLSS